MSSFGNGGGDAAGNNPFLTASKLPYQAADFANIKSTDFKDAYDAGIAQQQQEYAQIANNTAAPTFENTLVALERSGIILRRVNGVFGLLSSANTDPVLQALGEEVAPKLASLNDEMYLNSKLYKRVEAVYNAMKSGKYKPATAEDKRLVEFYYQHFQMAGANLNDADKESLKLLN